MVKFHLINIHNKNYTESYFNRMSKIGYDLESVKYGVIYKFKDRPKGEQYKSYYVISGVNKFLNYDSFKKVGMNPVVKTNNSSVFVSLKEDVPLDKMLPVLFYKKTLYKNTLISLVMLVLSVLFFGSMLAVDSLSPFKTTGTGFHIFMLAVLNFVWLVVLYFSITNLLVEIRWILYNKDHIENEHKKVVYSNSRYIAKSDTFCLYCIIYILPILLSLVMIYDVFARGSFVFTGTVLTISLLSYGIGYVNSKILVKYNNLIALGVNAGMVVMSLLICYGVFNLLVTA